MAYLCPKTSCGIFLSGGFCFMSDKVNFSKTLFSMSAAPGAAYFELVVIFQHICTDVDY